MSGSATDHKVHETFSPSAPSSRRTPKVAVEYAKPSRQPIKEYERLFRKAEVYATAAMDPTRAPDPPSSYNASRPSKSQQKAISFVPPTPSHPYQINRVNLAGLYTDPNPAAVLGTVSTTPLDGLPGVSFSPTPEDSAGGGSVATRNKKSALGIMADFLKSHKRPEINTAYDPVHLTRVGFNSSTVKFTGLPKEWQQLLQDSGISKSDQEKNPPVVVEVVKFYLEGGGDVWHKMGHATVRGISPPPLTLGAAPATYSGASKSVNSSAEGPRNSPNADDGVRSQASDGTVAGHSAPRPPTAPQQQSAAVASSAKAASATPGRREKKKDKANHADIIKRLQQICTDADPTQLYRNLVKIGQG